MLEQMTSTLRPLRAGALSMIAIGLAGCMTNPQPPSVDGTHSNAIVLDGHADIVLPTTSAQYLGADGRSKTAIDKLVAGGFDAVVMTAGVSPGPRTPEGDRQAAALAREKIEAAQALAAENSDTVMIATSAEDVLTAHANRKIAFILGLQNARTFGPSVDPIDDFYAMGVRVFGFNHIGHNAFSDSSRPVFDGDTGQFEPVEEHGGLSDLGRAAVARLNALGGVIDVSQSSKAATLQIAELSTAPVIASHSNARALSDVSRNLSDDEIDLIAAKGGVIHIAAFAAYLEDYDRPDFRAQIDKVRADAGLPATYSYPYELYWEIDDPAAQRTFLMSMRSVIGPSSVARMVDHIDYVVDRVGIDHVGIGSDFNHGGGVAGFVEADGAQSVTEELMNRGYSTDDIAKIWGGNFLRVLSAAEASTSSTGDTAQ